MKKLVCLLFATLCFSQAFAADTANIKIKIAGTSDGTYYLCMPDLGCLSMQAADNGKVYTMFNDINMNTLFLTNIHNMQIYNQGLPSSCNVTVKTNQTITITGTLNASNKERVKVDNLHCTVS